jgi:hypothetical protein
MRRSLVTMFFAAAVPAAIMAAPPPQATAPLQVRVDRAAFNPSAGDSVALVVTTRAAGELTVVVLDRDGFPVTTLAAARKTPAGTARFTWNGRDANGAIIPDEAYSFKVDWNGGGERASYFPANQTVAMRSVPASYFDRQGGTLVYELNVPSRVHIQAGWAVAKGGQTTGPVMKTIVDREPRVAGRVAEHWNGFDESGSIYVPDLPDFVTAIAVTPLPENSVIAFGNRQKTFVASLAARKGRSELTVVAKMHAHHASLSAADDHSPELRLEPIDARWSPAERLWIATGETLHVRVTPSGPTAAAFVRQPAKLYQFINRSPARTAAPFSESTVVEVPARLLVEPVNRISFNWRSDYGPVAANTLRVRRETKAPAAQAGATR